MRKEIVLLALGVGALGIVGMVALFMSGYTLGREYGGGDGAPSGEEATTERDKREAAERRALVAGAELEAANKQLAAERNRTERERGRTDAVERELARTQSELAAERGRTARAARRIRNLTEPVSAAIAAETVFSVSDLSDMANWMADVSESGVGVEDIEDIMEITDEEGTALVLRWLDDVANDLSPASDGDRPGR